MLALWIAAFALLAGPTAIAFDSGGFAVPAQAVGAVIAFALLVVVALTAPWPLVERSWPLAALVAFAAFVAWTAASLAWTRALGDGANDADRVVFYLAVFALAVVVMRTRDIRRIAPDALMWGIVVVALYALGGRLFPDLVDTEAIRSAGDRLSQPLTYWNAMGILTAFGALLATAVAANGARPLVYRSAACAAAVPCALACYLTFSRGSWVALGAGLAVCLLVRPRASAALAAGLWLAATGALALVLRAFPAVLHLDHGRMAQADDGVAVATIAAALAFAAGLTFARLADRAPDGPDVARRARGVLAVAVVPVVLVAACLVTFNAERSEEISKSAARVTTLKTLRGDYWRVAFDSFADHPAAGVGTASFPVEWRRERDVRVFTHDAHSLYLETLAELGLIGAALLAAAMGTVLMGLRRRWRTTPSDPLLAASAGVLAAFAVHAGLDWDWEMPAVTLIALVIAAAAIQAPQRAGRLLEGLR